MWQTSLGIILGPQSIWVPIGRYAAVGRDAVMYEVGPLKNTLITEYALIIRFSNVLRWTIKICIMALTNLLCVSFLYIFHHSNAHVHSNSLIKPKNTFWHTTCVQNRVLS